MCRASRWGLACALLGACATAAPNEAPPVDAPKSIDAPPQIDAPVDLCASTSTCQAATDLGSISGDTGSDMVTANGYQSTWVKVRATEDDSGLSGRKLTVTAQLTSPANASYGVFVYVNSGNDVIECTTPSGTPSTSGSTETVKVKWGEGSIPNGSDDSRTVSIEVRPMSSTCSAAQPWQLVVLGN